jgi:hypothetical protein
LGRGLASAEGVVRVKTPGDDPVIETRYTALHVNEDGAWRAASVREWVPDPAMTILPKHLEVLVGDWTATGSNGELKINYAWDENKTFLIAKYSVTKDGKPGSSGMQIFALTRGDGLRSWTFDSSGVTSEGTWARDDNRWICESVGQLPNGEEITALNVIVPLGPDAFTWQTTDREADGVPLPSLPPVKVTRVKK